MAKQFNLDIDRYQASLYVDAVRSKRDVVMLWMETIKNFLVGYPADGENIHARLSIYIDTMSRLFCTLEGGKKVFSVAFPFGVTLKDDVFSFYSREGIEIDHRVSSNVISLIKANGIFGAQDFSHFIDPILEMSDIDPLLWVLVRELMLAEDGYIRYDWDEQRQDGHRHPLHHLDVCYTNSGTFKIGLPEHIDLTALVAILEKSTDCHYLRPAQ